MQIPRLSTKHNYVPFYGIPGAFNTFLLSLALPKGFDAVKTVMKQKTHLILSLKYNI